MWWLGLALIAVGVVLVPTVAKAASVGGSGSDLEKMRKAAQKLSPAIVQIAKKHATAKGIPLREVLATILRESQGKPKAHNLSAKEDSRGLMQVNVRAHEALLAKKKLTPNDLYDADHGIDVGTEIYASARSKVKALVAASKVPQQKQAHDLGTLTRLYYAGPTYVQEGLKKAQTTIDTKHFFKNSELYVDHWANAIQAVTEAGLA